MEPDSITDGKSNSRSNLTADAQEEKSLGCSNESSRVVSSPGAMEQHPSEGKDSCTDSTLSATKAPAIVPKKRVFDESTVEAATRWVNQLDTVVAAGQEADPNFASMYNAFFTKTQKQAHCMTAVAKWEEHRLKDGEDLLKITSAGWSCNMCPDHVSRQKRPDRIYTHFLTDNHINKVKVRASLRGVQNVASSAAAHAQLQLVPQMIRQGTCITAAQASLPFTAGSLMLEGLKSTML